MNFFYCESKPAPNRDTFLTKNYGNGIQSIDLRQYVCHYMHDEGALLGVCTSADYVLFYLGCITGMNESHRFNSLERPNDVAEHLMGAFNKQGVRFFETIKGDFCIAIVNKSSSDVYLVNDYSANKPIFYCHEEGRLSFSSQLYPMHQHFDVDRNNEDFLLGYEFLPNQATFYKNVRKLPGGTLYRFCDGCLRLNHSGRNEKIPKTVHSGNPQVLINQLYDTFMAVLEEQLSGAKKTAVIMGGFDSALVASAIKRLGVQVTSYTFCFQNEKYNQPNVSEISNFLGTAHRWVDIDQDVIRRGLSNFHLEFNHIASQPHYLIQTSHAVKKIRQDGFLHAFTGDGCDGIFQGYPTVHLRAKLLEKSSRIPKPLLNLALRLLQLKLFEKAFGHPLRILRNAVKVSTREMPVRAFIAARIFDEYALASLYGENNSINSKKIEALLKELSEGLENLSVVELAYLGKSMPGLNKNKLDGSSKASGVALFSPYLHSDLVNFVGSLPKEQFRPEGHGGILGAGKHILNRMAEEKQLLPEKIIYQKKKSPVNAPVDVWYNGELAPFLLSLCKNLPFDFNSSYVTGLVPDRLSEALYRKLKPIDTYAAHAICLLATYAQFSK